MTVAPNHVQSKEANRISGWGNTRENFNPVHNYPPLQNPGGKGATRKNLVKKLGQLN